MSSQIQKINPYASVKQILNALPWRDAELITVNWANQWRKENNWNVDDYYSTSVLKQDPNA